MRRGASDSGSSRYDLLASVAASDQNTTSGNEAANCFKPVAVALSTSARAFSNTTLFGSLSARMQRRELEKEYDMSENAYTQIRLRKFLC